MSTIAAAAYSSVPLMPAKTLIASRLKPAAPVSLTSSPPSGSPIAVADRLHGVLELVGLALAGLDGLDDQRRRAVGRVDRLLRLEHQRCAGPR